MFYVIDQQTYESVHHLDPWFWSKHKAEKLNQDITEALKDAYELGFELGKTKVVSE